MNEDVFNTSVRKFLKRLGVTAQREIEKAVRQGLAEGNLCLRHAASRRLSRSRLICLNSLPRLAATVKAMKPPPRVETCRAHALKCRFAAERAVSAASRNQFLDLAQHWESMAHTIEEIEALRRRLSATANLAID